ncbi:hypothetical protein [Bacillus canaveralius]|uniref:hypothetical protein n=1 Tax=Bacillus canaveralius TaxID=1403243 RepID=UPI001C60D928|nr:hypothetical protein [Bacillus canaveralius]
MIESVNRFALKELSLDKVKKINGSFSARGSNIPVSTIIWYFNLLKVKFELNPDAIRFPLVLDSPNNVELMRINRRHSLIIFLRITTRILSLSYLR